MNILWIEDFGQLDSGVNTLTLMFQNLISFDNINKDSLNLIDYPNQLAEFCQQQASVHCIYLCRNYFDYVDFKNNHAIVIEIDAIINLPCWFKTSAFRPKGAPRNKRSDVALSGAD